MSTAQVLALIHREAAEQVKRAAKHPRSEHAHHRHLYTARRVLLLAERIEALPNEAPEIGTIKSRGKA